MTNEVPEYNGLTDQGDRELEGQLYLMEVDLIMDTYGITLEEAKIAHERQKVYGDPKVNHDGIAQAWAGLLQPYAVRIGEMRQLPAHVVALMMASLKMNRMRMVFHEDNFDDLSVYMSFARAWQRDEPVDTTLIGPKPSATARLVLRWEEPPGVKGHDRPRYSKMVQVDPGSGVRVILTASTDTWSDGYTIVTPTGRVEDHRCREVAYSLYAAWRQHIGKYPLHQDEDIEAIIDSMIDDLKNPGSVPAPGGSS